MPRPRKVDRPVTRKYNIPESLATQVDLLLWSTLEGRVPHGKHSELIEALLRAWLEKQLEEVV